MCYFKSKVIYDKDDDFGDIMIMALKYALGKRTYVTSEVCDFVKQNIKHVNNRIRDVMIRDIEEYKSKREQGFISDDSCDEHNFTDLLASLEKVGEDFDEKET